MDRRGRRAVAFVVIAATLTWGSPAALASWSEQFSIAAGIGASRAFGGLQFELQRESHALFVAVGLPGHWVIPGFHPARVDGANEGLPSASVGARLPLRFIDELRITAHLFFTRTGFVDAQSGEHRERTVVGAALLLGYRVELGSAAYLDLGGGPAAMLRFDELSRPSSVAEEQATVRPYFDIDLAFGVVF